MTAAPYLEDTPSVIAHDHGNVIRARLVHPSFGELELDLDRLRGHQLRVEFEETRAPRASATLVCGIPDVAIDARAGVRLAVDAGYQRLTGLEDVQPFVDLGVRKAPVDWVADTLQVSAAGDESLMIDASPAVAESVTGTTTALAIESLIGKALSPAPTFVPSIAGAAVTVDTVEDRWQAAQDLADRIGAQLWDNGLRDWYLAPMAATAGEVAHTLAVGQGGTVLEPSRSTDRDEWFNYARLVYRWRNASGADQQVVGTAWVASGDYRIAGPAGRRIYTDTRNVATTQAAANAAAQAVLLRLVTRGDVMTLRAVAAYWLRPGMTVRVILPDGQPRLVLVSRVAFDLLDGTMTVTTRSPLALPVDSTEASPTGTSTPPASSPTPDPAPPAKLAYSTEWPASSTATYRGTDSSKRTDVDAGDLWQGGFPGGFNGNMTGLALFTAANSVPSSGKRGETGKTVSQALAGVSTSDIRAVYLIATMEHTWNSPPKGSDVLLGYFDGTAAPATGLATKPYKASKGWTKGTRRAESIASTALYRDLVDGSARGVTFGGSAAGLDTDYYARLGSIRLRIDYAK